MSISNNIGGLSMHSSDSNFVNNLSNGNKFYPFDRSIGKSSNFIGSGVNTLVNDSACSVVTMLSQPYTSTTNNIFLALVKNFKSNILYKLYSTGDTDIIGKLVTAKSDNLFTNTRLISLFNAGSGISDIGCSLAGLNNEVISYSNDTIQILIPSSNKFLDTNSFVVEIEGNNSNYCTVYQSSGYIAFERSGLDEEGQDYIYSWNGTPILSSYKLEAGEAIVGAWVDYDVNMDAMHSNPSNYIYVATRKDSRLNIIQFELGTYEDSFDKILQCSIYNHQFNIMTDFQLTGVIGSQSRNIFACVFNAVIGNNLQWFKAVCRQKESFKFILDYNEPLEQIGDNNYVAILKEQNLYTPEYIPFFEKYGITRSTNVFDYSTHGILDIYCVSDESNAIFPVGEATLSYYLFNEYIANEDMIWIPVKKDNVINAKPHSELFFLIAVETSFDRDRNTVAYTLDKVITLNYSKILNNTIYENALSIDYVVPYDCILCCNKNDLYSIEG